MYIYGTRVGVKREMTRGAQLYLQSGRKHVSQCCSLDSGQPSTLSPKSHTPNPFEQLFKSGLMR